MRVNPDTGEILDLDYEPGVAASYLDARGWERPDATPVQRALKWNRPGSTLDEIRAALGLIHREALQQGVETFEEADDFDVGDDYDPTSPWEIRPDQELAYQELQASSLESNGDPAQPGSPAGAPSRAKKPKAPAPTPPAPPKDEEDAD